DQGPLALYAAQLLVEPGELPASDVLVLLALGILDLAADRCDLFREFLFFLPLGLESAEFLFGLCAFAEEVGFARLMVGAGRDLAVDDPQLGVDQADAAQAVSISDTALSGNCRLGM